MSSRADEVRPSLVPGHSRPPAQQPEDRAPARSIPVAPRAPWVWLLVFAPWIEVIGTLIAGAIIGSVTWGLIALIVALGAIAGLGVARADRAALEGTGFDRMPGAAFALLPALYLAVRGSRMFSQAGTGMRPLWIHLLAALSVPFAAYFINTWGNGLFLASTAF